MLYSNNSLEIRPDEIPSTSPWAFIPMYKFLLTGEVQYWQVGYDGINLEIKSGDVNIEEIEVNHLETTPESALIAARNLFREKFREGYRTGEIVNQEPIKGMKGVEYKQKSVKSWPVYTQPKLNGIRLLVNYAAGDKVVLRSWLNNKYTHLKHIELELKTFFEYLPVNSILDGELYNHDMDFSTIVSAIKTTKSIHPKLKDISYWIFDIDYKDPKYLVPYEHRYALLVNSYKRYLEDGNIPLYFKIVQAQIANNHDDIIRQHDEYVNTGYEGIMIKKISNNIRTGNVYKMSLYKPGKNANIMKYKNFKDEEAKIIENIDDKVLVKDLRGNKFKLSIRGEVGQQVTYRYIKLLNNMVPDNPIAISIRDYE